jgi:hypothetical protein
MSSLYRYPGVKPFGADEKDLFFGREEDIFKLYKLINVEQMVVVYSKSGLGKSSLLNAGILPRLQTDAAYLPLSIRFGNYMKDSSSPVEMVRARIQELYTRLDQAGGAHWFAEDESLWAQLKQLQWHSQQADLSVVLIFDQFEELFTYPPEQVLAFKQQLAEVLNTKLPQRIRERMRERVLESGSAQVIAAEHDQLLYEPLHVKCLMAIRSDRMSLLNQLTDYLPSILTKCYELRPLTYGQAQEAILSPAYLRDNRLISPPFDYDDDALDKMLDFLTKNNRNSVESFQLQVLCQHAENVLMDKVKQGALQPFKLFEQDLGNLNDIYQNYYDHQIQKLESGVDKRVARHLIEDGLILEEPERRLSLYEGQIINQFTVPSVLLQKLVDSHLLRAEPNSAGDMYYEISHDSLIAPILKARRQRKEEERRQQELARRQQEFKKRTRRIVVVASVAIGFVLVLLGSLLFYQEIRISATNIRQLEADNDSLYQKTADLKTETEILANRYNSLRAISRRIPDSLNQEIQKIHAQLENDSLKIRELERTIAYLRESNTDKDRRLDSARLDLRTVVLQIRALNDRLKTDIYLIKTEKDFKRLNDGIFEDYKRLENELYRKYPNFAPPTSRQRRQSQ